MVKEPRIGNIYIVIKNEDNDYTTIKDIGKHIECKQIDFVVSNHIVRGNYIINGYDNISNSSNIYTNYELDEL